MYYFELFDAAMFGIMMVLLLCFTGTLVHSIMKIKASASKSNMLYWAEEWTKEKIARDLAQSEYDYTIDCMCQQFSRDILKAKREHGKKIRKAADRKLERTEREYEAQLNLAAEQIRISREANTNIRANMGEIRAELTAFQSIVGQELENFVRLPSVRKAMLAAINQQHKAWKEL